MAGNNFSQTYGPSFGGGVFQVASQFLGQAIINNVRKQFPNQKTKRGDAYMDGVRYLLQTNLDIINPDDRPKIEVAYGLARGMRTSLSTHDGSKVQRFLKAREYKCHCKKLYVVTKFASDRGIDDSLMEQFRRATGGTGPDTPDASDDPPPPPFMGSSVNTLDEVEMTTFRSETTGDVAVTLTLRGKDGKDTITQDVITTISPEVLADDNADHKGPSITLVPIDKSSIIGGHAKADEER
jgi:hypothetical protein